MSKNHVFVDEQLMNFGEKNCHTLQITNKTVKKDFKIYNLCEKINLFDLFLFSRFKKKKIEIQNTNN